MDSRRSCWFSRRSRDGKRVRIVRVTTCSCAVAISSAWCLIESTPAVHSATTWARNAVAGHGWNVMEKWAAQVHRQRNMSEKVLVLSNTRHVQAPFR